MSFEALFASTASGPGPTSLLGYSYPHISLASFKLEHSYRFIDLNVNVSTVLSLLFSVECSYLSGGGSFFIFWIVTLDWTILWWYHLSFTFSPGNFQAPLLPASLSAPTVGSSLQGTE